MKKIPFLDLKAAVTELRQEIDVAIARVMDSGTYILGAEVDLFEREFSIFCESNYCVGVANGLDALHLTLKAWNIGYGDEVIVPSNTYIATWLAVTQSGATVIPVEPLTSTYNININLIEQAITKKTKAIIVVHLYGLPADLNPIMELANKYGIKVLEDAAQSHGAKYKNKMIGSHSHAVAWSFYPGKNLGALGDGGAITSNDKNFIDKIYSLRNYGSSQKYVNDLQGYNSRLDPIQAAVLRVKLNHLNHWNSRRRNIAKIYMDALKDSNVILPFVPDWAEPAWHLFVIRHPLRNDLLTNLTNTGCGALIHYPIPPNIQRAYSHLKIQSQPIAEMLANEVISLPIGPHLSEEDANYVATKVIQFSKD
jgi:dTDP-4-amino-4,6-dideoxygalactose transaminase